MMNGPYFQRWIAVGLGVVVFSSQSSPRIAEGSKLDNGVSRDMPICNETDHRYPDEPGL